MAPEHLRRMALATFVSVLLWIPLMFAGQIELGPIENDQQLIRAAGRFGLFLSLGYINAVCFTILNGALLLGLYFHLRQEAPLLCLVGVATVPVYTVLNVFAYGAQVTVLPMLTQRLTADPGNLTYQTLIVEVAHFGHGLVATLNGLAYTLHGIPSIAFAVAMYKKSQRAVWIALVMILNAVVCLLGFVGHLVPVPALSMGIVMGGLIWVVAVGMLWRFFRREALAAKRA